MQKRGQSSVEFSVLISFMFFAFIIFFSIMGWRLGEISRDNDKRMLDDLGDYIQNEISLAASSGQGYLREFDIPSTLSGKRYNVEIQPLLAAGWGENYTQLVLDFNQTRRQNSYIGTLPLKVNGTIDPSINRTVVIKNTQSGIEIFSYTQLNCDNALCEKWLGEDCSSCPNDCGIC